MYNKYLFRTKKKLVNLKRKQIVYVAMKYSYIGYFYEIKAKLICGDQNIQISSVNTY